MVTSVARVMGAPKIVASRHNDTTDEEDAHSDGTEDYDAFDDYDDFGAAIDEPNSVMAKLQE